MNLLLYKFISYSKINLLMSEISEAVIEAELFTSAINLNGLFNVSIPKMCLWIFTISALLHHLLDHQYELDEPHIPYLDIIQISKKVTTV